MNVHFEELSDALVLLVNESVRRLIALYRGKSPVAALNEWGRSLTAHLLHWILVQVIWLLGLQCLALQEVGEHV